MAVSNKPIFTQAAKHGRQRLAAANTARDGSGTVPFVLLEDNATDFTGATDGSLIKRITFMSAQATAAASGAKVGRIYISDSTGANLRLIDEIIIGAQTPSTTVLGAMGFVDYARRTGGLKIGSGVKIGVTISVYAGVQDQTDVIMEYENF
jgi:hypothetical protein